MKGGIYLLLGSNLGDRLNNLWKARTRTGSVLQSSPVFVTAAWGNLQQPQFYNQAVEIDSDLPPDVLLRHLLDIEAGMGRERTEKWGSRIIDIDILFYRDQIIDTKHLIVPHPEIQNRRFALEPMHEISPELVHPVLKKTIRQLLEECRDPLEVKRLPQ